MRLYHGSATGGITTLVPRFSNQEDPHLYLTPDQALATIYSHSPVKGGYFPYFYDKEGRLCYEEYFPDALSLYKGLSGYVYTVEAEDLPQREKMPWVYLSREPVPVIECRFIADIYEELLRLEENGAVKLIRFGDLEENKLKGIYMMLRRNAESLDLKNRQDEYAQFFKSHFPFLL